jgi:YHS domain-containing protein
MRSNLTPNVVCPICGNPVKTNASRIAEGRGKFCSKSCYYESKRFKPEDAWRHVDQSGGPDACWEWQGTITSWGYGQVKVNKQLWRAHRLIYVLVNGPIPEDLFILHGCDNRRCCNPSHLRIGTHDENMIDMVSRSRQWTSKSHPRSPRLKQ